MPKKLLERFLRYVQIDTTSDPESPTCPSTAKQWDLLRLLAGCIDLHVSQEPLEQFLWHSYVIPYCGYQIALTFSRYQPAQRHCPLQSAARVLALA